MLIRHGQSRYNVRLTDNLDSELTDEGRRQVVETADFLARHFAHLDQFIGHCSPYLRCLQTAQIIRELTGVEFWVTPGPREIMMVYDECQVPYRQSDFPELIWETHCTPTGFRFRQETAQQFVNRMSGYLREVTEHERVLIVSHGSPVNMLYDLALGRKAMPDLHTYVENSSISYIRGKEPVWFNRIVYEKVHGERVLG